MQFKKPWFRYFWVASGALLSLGASSAQSLPALTGCASETPPFILMKDLGVRELLQMRKG